LGHEGFSSDSRDHYDTCDSMTPTIFLLFPFIHLGSSRYPYLSISYVDEYHIVKLLNAVLVNHMIFSMAVPMEPRRSKSRQSLWNRTAGAAMMSSVRT
jgi:hypothetical protein